MVIRNILWLFRVTFTYILPYPFMGELNHFNSRRNYSNQESRYREFLSSPIRRLEIHDTLTVKNHGKTTENSYIHKTRVNYISHIYRKIRRLFCLYEYSLLDGPFSVQRSEDYSCGVKAKCVQIHSGLKPIPGGMVYLNYQIHSESGLAELILYIDAGFGFNRDFCIPLPATTNRIHSILLDLPPFIDILRFKVRDITGGNVHLETINIRETNVFSATRQVAESREISYRKALHDLFIRQFPFVRTPDALKGSYCDWIERNDLLLPEDRKIISRLIRAYGNQTNFHIVLTCTDFQRTLLIRSLIGINKQLYPHWDLTIISAANISDLVIELIDQYKIHCCTVTCELNDPIINAGIIEVILDNPEAYFCFLEPGDILPDHALYLVSRYIGKYPDCKILYGDHDHMDSNGHRFDHSFKPDWNYEMFLENNYLGKPIFLHAQSLISSLNNPDVDVLTSHDDLSYLLLEELAENEIRHLPFILCHRYPEPPAQLDGSNLFIINNHLRRNRMDATVSPHPVMKHLVKINRYSNVVDVPVSLIIPTRNQFSLLSACVSGMLDKTDYSDLELLIIDNDSDDQQTIAYLETMAEDPRVRVLSFPGEFNYSAINNVAVEHASHEYVGLINNDISVIHGCWLQEMMRQLVRPEVGIVGAKLLYADDTVQHGGVIIGLGGVAGHSFRHFPRFDIGYNDRMFVVQQLSCTTGACLLTKKSLYRKLGGLDEVNLKIAFNDVDYCLKMRESGHLIIWTPYAELYHFESASRGSDLDSQNLQRWTAEYEYMKHKWGDYLHHEPAYNPNLTNIDENFHIAHLPRVFRP